MVSFERGGLTGVLAGFARRYDFRLLLAVLVAGIAQVAWAHGVEDKDAAYLQQITGVKVFPLMYLGAKHMVTGFDHLLFLTGVIFFLHRLKDIALYVTLFAVGHSLTLLSAVLMDIRANSHLVDAIIAISVVYKAFENIGGFDRLGLAIDLRKAVFGFGLVHGLGLATKIQNLDLQRDGLVENILSFNIGVELGQFLALALMLVGFRFWRRSSKFRGNAFLANVVIMAIGFALLGYQVTGYLVSA